jgi:NTP pyrophosphatase (non-canonical NTP hydrolase)
MKIYILMKNDTLISAHWNEGMALASLLETDPSEVINGGIRDDSIFWIARVNMDPVNDLVGDYFRHRNLVYPDTNQAFLFLVSEVGELADKLVHDQRNWVRNNPDTKDDDRAGEIADVLMMLAVLSETLGIDPIEAMQDKFNRKGYGG